MEQRQVVLDTGGQDGFRNIAVYARPTGLDRECIAKTFPEFLDSGSIERKFSRRKDTHCVDGLRRQLRPGIEDAQILDLIIEEIDSHRLGSP